VKIARLSVMLVLKFTPVIVRLRILSRKSKNTALFLSGEKGLFDMLS